MLNIFCTSTSVLSTDVCSAAYGYFLQYLDFVLSSNVADVSSELFEIFPVAPLLSHIAFLFFTFYIAVFLLYCLYTSENSRLLS